MLPNVANLKSIDVYHTIIYNPLFVLQLFKKAELPDYIRYKQKSMHKTF